MKTSSAKAKGRRCAQEVRELILKYLPDLKPDDIYITSSGETGEDLKLSPTARESLNVCIECKNVEALNIWNALEQAESHLPAQENTFVNGLPRTPVVFFRRNRSKLFVALDAEAFIKLVT